MIDDDVTLVKKTLEGDKAAFNLLVSRTTPRVFGIIYRFFHDRARAEDIAQNVYINAYTRLCTYGQDRPFSNWLAAITVRHCYKALKETKNDRHISESALGSETLAALDSFCYEPLHGSKTHIEKSLILNDIVEKILQRLTPKERMLLVLIEVEGMRVKEIADIMGMSQINVKVSGFRARSKALKILEKLWRTEKFQETLEELNI